MNVLPHQGVSVTSRSQLDAFSPERLLIKHGERWVVDDIYIGNRSLLSRRDKRERRPRPGADFSPDALGAPGSLLASFLAPGEEVTLMAEYVGTRESGEPLEACILGTAGRAPAARRLNSVNSVNSVDQTDVLSVRASAALPVRGDKREMRLFAPPRARDFYPERLRLIVDASADWVVNDVRVNDQSLLTQAGDLPVAMFGGDDASLLELGHLLPTDEFSVLATYLGDRDDAVLAYDLSGPLRSRDLVAESSLLLPMSSSVNILPDTTAYITSRARDRILPKGNALQPRRVVIEDPASWVVNDVKVGNVSQYAQNGDVPGVTFSAGAVGCEIALAPVPIGIDFAIIVTYVGDRESGAPFVCGVAGSVVRSAY